MSLNHEMAGLAAEIREQVLFLQELGVENFSVTMPEVKTAAVKIAESQRTEKFVPASAAEIPKLSIIPAKAPPAKGSRIATLPSLAKRTPPTLVAPTAIENPKAEEPKQLQEPIIETRTEILSMAAPAGSETIESIRADIGDCTRCPLHVGRKQIVHSTGNFNAQLMFVGEAPGADEDEQGVPFVGRAGQLLTKIIESIGIKREDVFIGNINRCRPPENRQPLPIETAACRPFLLREIEVLKPKIIVVLGATAAHNLLQIKTPISKIRGNFHDYFGVKVMPTFHPAYLLRDPHKKREVWEDMKKVRDFLQS